MNNYLLVPPTGLLQVWEGESLNTEAALTANGGEGVLVSLTFEDPAHVLVEWFTNPLAPVNPRARETLVQIGGPHAIFTGPVMFSGLPASEVLQVVTHLSRKE